MLAQGASRRKEITCPGAEETSLQLNQEQPAAGLMGDYRYDPVATCKKSATAEMGPHAAFSLLVLTLTPA